MTSKKTPPHETFRVATDADLNTCIELLQLPDGDELREAGRDRWSDECVEKLIGRIVQAQRATPSPPPIGREALVKIIDGWLKTPITEGEWDRGLEAGPLADAILAAMPPSSGVEKPNTNSAQNSMKLVDSPVVDVEAEVEHAWKSFEHFYVTGSDPWNNGKDAIRSALRRVAAEADRLRGMVWRIRPDENGEGGESWMEMATDRDQECIGLREQCAVHSPVLAAAKRVREYHEKVRRFEAARHTESAYHARRSLGIALDALTAALEEVDRG